MLEHKKVYAECPGKVIMKCLSGSKAYGTSLPTSDTDIRGIFIAHPEHILTPWERIDDWDMPDEEDGKLYEVKRFMELFVDMNPNIIELMFVREEEILESTPEYWYLRNFCQRMLTNRVAMKFSRYAMAQLKRIKGHDKWINDPQPELVPTQGEFLTLVHSFMPGKMINTRAELFDKLKVMSDFCVLMPLKRNTYAVMEADERPGIFNEDGSIRKLEYKNFSSEQKREKPLMLIEYLVEEHRAAKEKHRNYWQWKNNRNVIRHELEVNYGYDTKHAMHLVRLMRMSKEMLTDGTVNVFRPDAAELLEIRAGKWTLEELLQYADDINNEVENVLLPNTKLPAEVDMDLAKEILMEVQMNYWTES